MVLYDGALARGSQLLPLSFRVDIINLPNRTTFANPNLTPASTDFGRITAATAASPRFIQFVSKFTF